MKRNTTGSYFEAKPPAESIHLRFESRVAARPEAIAVVYEDHVVTYGHLNQKANLLAHYLIDLGIGPDSLVALCVERSIDMIVAILGVLKAGGAYVPMDPSYPRERLAWLLEDLKPSSLLTQQFLRDQLPAAVDHLVCLDADWPVIAEHGRLHNPVVDVDPDNVCYVIYTSGSTGQPKGVPVHHRNLLRLFDATQPWFEINEQDVWTLHHSYAFDFSVWEIFGAILHGGRLVIVANWVVRSPEASWDVLSRERVTVLNQTPSGFLNLMSADQGSEGQGDHLALSLIIFGGEALNLGALRSWFHRHGDAHPLLVNMYGITETTVHVTYRPLTMQDAERAEHSWIGEPIPDLQVYLLDAQMNLVPRGVAGEIYVGGDGVARGYLNRPELAAERFVPDPFSLAHGARLYRSGDNGRFLADGDLAYLGRADHQVKIRGHRIELGEIESQLARHSAVRESVVAMREGASGDKQLIAYIVPHAADDRADDEVEALGPQLRRMLKDYLPDYMVPSAFVFLDELPRTVNGKIDRRALPVPLTVGAPGGQEPRTPVEEILSGIFAEVLGHERVGVNQNFSDLGGHSLLATQVVSRVRQILEVEIGLRALFESPTVAGLARTIEQERGAGRGVEAPPIKPVGRGGELPLSFAQQRLWFIQQLEPESAAYNIPIVMRVKGEIQSQCMWQSLGEIERRHEALRTRFEERNGRPVQLIDKAREVEAWTCDLSGVTEEAREECAREIAEREWRRPFALDGERLWRSGMIRLGEGEQVLVMCMHHVVSDGWSTGVMIREFSRIYESYVSGRQSPLEELEVQYADYAVWQREWLQGEALEEHLKYWRRQLAMAPVLRFRTDQEQPPGMTGQLAAKAPFIIPVELTEAVKRLSRSEGVTLFMTLLAVYQITLGRYRHQEDVVVGTGVAGRNRMEVEGLIGFFINQLALRVRLEDRLTFRELLGRIREVTLGAYAHQDLPYEKLVEALAPKRDLIGAPLFEASLILQNMPQEQVDLPMFRLSPFPEGPQIAKYPLELIVEESPDQLIGALRYATNALYHTDAELLVAQLKELLSIVTIQPDLSLSSLKAKLDEFDSKYRAARRDSIKGVIERRLSGRRHPSSMST